MSFGHAPESVGAVTGMETDSAGNLIFSTILQPTGELADGGNQQFNALQEFFLEADFTELRNKRTLLANRSLMHKSRTSVACLLGILLDAGEQMSVFLFSRSAGSERATIRDLASVFHNPVVVVVQYFSEILRGDHPVSRLLLRSYSAPTPLRLRSYSPRQEGPYSAHTPPLLRS